MLPNYSGPEHTTLHEASVGSRRRPSRWRLALGVLLTLGILLLAVVNRAWLIEALWLARTAQPVWLLLALVTVMGSFLLSSQVLQIVLHSLGHRLGILQLWASALVAIVMSQVFPGGGIGSYAFLLDTFRRRGVAAGEAALVATLEALSYAGAMVIFAVFGLAYLASRILAADPDGSSLLAPLLAMGMALLLIAAVMLLLTRSEATLARLLLRLHTLLASTLRRPRTAEWVYQTVAALGRGRGVVAKRPGALALLVLIQLSALTGHSLGLYLILLSLGTQTSFLTVVAAFGIALLTSTINVLPGGGGTVEATLLAVLTQLGVGAAAVPAAILFRLLNFWMLLPIAAACYGWLSRSRSPH